MNQIRLRRAPAAAILFFGVLMAISTVRTQFTISSPTLASVLDNYVFNGAQIGFALCVIWRGLALRAERAAWITIGASMLAWCAGNVAFPFLPRDASTPSISDGLWLSAYPGFYVGLWLLFRGRVHGVNRASVLDGAVVGLAVAALAAGVVFQAVWNGVGGGVDLAVATNLAYPLGDLVLLSLVSGAMVATGRRLSGAWALLAVGLAIFALADSIYLWKAAKGFDVDSTITSTFWSYGLATMAISAWLPPRRSAAPQSNLNGLIGLFGGSTVALGLLSFGANQRLGALATGLATATLAAVLLRLAITHRENLDLLRAARREATTDHLTGLANRRQLLDDLERAISDRDLERSALVIFDLDGFKGYNDALGHVAGDALLARLGERLALAVGGRGAAYRMGGDEFCVLVPARHEHAEELAASFAAALREDHCEYSIGCSAGAAILPDDASDSRTALLVADARMYADKTSRREEPVPPRREQSYPVGTPIGHETPVPPNPQ